MREEGGRRDSEERVCEEDRLRRRIEKEKERKAENMEEKIREGGVWRTHFIILLSCCIYAIYTATIEVLPLRIINNRTGERGGS